MGVTIKIVKMKSFGQPLRLLIIFVLLILVGSCLVIALTPLFNNSAEIVDDVDQQNNFIAYYINHDPIEIHSNADFAALGFPGDGTKEFPYLISGYNITPQPYTVNLIVISNSDVYFVIEDCLLAGLIGDCILLQNMMNGVIRNNIMLGLNFGLHLRNASNIIAVDNTIDNTIFHGTNGIEISEYSENNTIAGNIITGNDNGIHLDDSKNILITNNVIADNKFYGLAVGYSENITIVNNTNVRNKVGVWLDFTVNNSLLYLNAIVDNEHVNAIDDGTDNKWNSTSAGNYWSDYLGTGVYEVNGSTSAIDYFPCFPPDTTPPIIDGPSNFECPEGRWFNITWKTNDAYPFNYVVYIRGPYYYSYHGNWYGDSITWETNPLNRGETNFTIVVYDASGNHASDTVIIKAWPIPVSTNNTTNDQTFFFLMMGGIGVVVVVAIFLLKRMSDNH